MPYSALKKPKKQVVHIFANNQRKVGHWYGQNGHIWIYCPYEKIFKLDKIILFKNKGLRTQILNLFFHRWFGDDSEYFMLIFQNI